MTEMRGWVREGSLDPIQGAVPVQAVIILDQLDEIRRRELVGIRRMATLDHLWQPSVQETDRYRFSGEPLLARNGRPRT
jgi:hypothetical protein